MITRTMEAVFLNEVANHPSVRPRLGGLGLLDLAPLIENPANVTLVAEGGGWIFVAMIPGIYEVHTLFLPHGRGRKFVQAAAHGFRYMFTQTDCLEIVTKCPDDNPGASIASYHLGFRERFRREDAWVPGVGVSYRVFSIDDWFVRDAECAHEGHEFHTMIEVAKRQMDSSLAAHPHDRAHDQAVGAAILMAKAGRIDKGMGFYNRWSIFAGYATIETVGPNAVDVGDAIVEIGDGKLRVLKCRLEPH